MLGLRKATEDLTQELGRHPDDSELLARLGVSADDLLEARLADMVFSAYSLDAPLSDRDDPSQLGDVLGGDDPGMEHTVDMEAVATHWEELPEREQVPGANIYGQPGEFRHTIVNTTYLVQVSRASVKSHPNGFTWLAKSSLATFPLSTISKKALARLPE